MEIANNAALFGSILLCRYENSIFLLYEIVSGKTFSVFAREIISLQTLLRLVDRVIYSPLPLP